jgi:hypothetical protein
MLTCKLVFPEHYYQTLNNRTNEYEDIRQLGSVLFLLMEKQQSQDGSFKISSSRWSRDIEEFLKVTRLASPSELRDVSSTTVIQAVRLTDTAYIY